MLIKGQGSLLALIGTNIVPSPAEGNEIRELIVERRAELSNLLLLPDTELAALNLRTHISALEAIISPIKKLFPELLSRIFEYCPLDEPHWSWAHTWRAPYPTRAPLLLTRVCAHWRAVAIATPRLWSDVVLICNYEEDSKWEAWRRCMERHARILETWLSWAGAMQVRVSISYGMVRVAEDDKEGEFRVKEWMEAAKSVVAKLVPHAGHIRTVRLYMPIQCMTPIFDKKLAFPVLRSLLIKHVEFGRMELDSLPYPRAFPLGRAKVFHRATISFPSSIWHTLDLPWHHLTSLYLAHDYSIYRRSTLSLGDALELLQRSRAHLRTFVLAINDDIGGVPESRIVVPFLKTISIKTSISQLGAFLSAVEVPALEKLTIRGERNQSELLAFFYRLQNPLKELVFQRSWDLLDTELTLYLQRLPLLKRLSTGCTLGARMIRDLTPDTSTDESLNCLCPRLEYMYITNRRPTEALVEMVEKRWRTGELKAVRLDLLDDDDDEDYEGDPVDEQLDGDEKNEEVLMARLQKCFDEGLQIKWDIIPEN